MGRKTTWFGIGTACLALAVAPHTVLAQQSILLRYHPQPNIRVQTLTRSQITLTIVEGTGETVDPDSLTIESSSLQSVTQRVHEVRGTQYILEVRVDSTRARMRPVGAAWQDIPDPGMRSARLVLDDRMRIAEVEVAAADSASADAQEFHGLAGGLELVFPEDPVAPGESWTADLVFSLKGLEGLEEETGFQEEPELIARSIVTLDSIVVRTSDTLSYLEVRGSFLPTMLTEAAEAAAGSVSVSGGFAGTVIWSTGWNAYVSGASRTLVTLVTRGRAGEVGNTTVTLRLDITERFQVRP